MESIKVKDYMNVRPITFKASASLSAALDKMLKSQQIGGPVVDENNRVIGFLSEQDVLHVLLKASYHCQSSETVKDCMHQGVVTLSPEDSVLKLAENMGPGKPKIYPVVDEKQHLVGTISRREILKALSVQFNACFNRPV